MVYEVMQRYFWKHCPDPESELKYFLPQHLIDEGLSELDRVMAR